MNEQHREELISLLQKTIDKLHFQLSSVPCKEDYDVYDGLSILEEMAASEQKLADLQNNR